MKKYKTINYHIYHFNQKEIAIFLLKWTGYMLVVSYLFFDSAYAVLFLIPTIFFFYKRENRQKIEARKQKLMIEFKEMILSLVTSLNGGYALENAFEMSKKDMQLLYPNGTLIDKELETILRGVQLNKPIEELLADFGNRSGMEDIRNFAEVVTVAKRSGGNMISIIEKTVRNISDKIETEREITTMIAAKRLEQRIMSVMPFFILIYMRIMNGAYISVLYHNQMGILVMGICLGLMWIASGWARGIIDISV